MARSKAEVIGSIRCLLLSKDEEMYMLSEFLSDFEVEAGYSLPQFEYKTVVDFFRSIPDIVEVISVEGKVYLRLVDEKEDYDKGEILTPSFKVKALGEDDDHESKSAAELEGLKGDPSKSRKKRKKNRKRNRVRKEKQKNKDQNKKGKGKVYDPSRFCKRCMTEPPAEGAKIDLYLSNIIFDESDIPQIDLRDHADIGDLIEVSVPEVSTPHRFILHLKKYQFELTKFMGKMMTFYTIYNDKYALERYTFKENEVCAAFYGANRQAREWYRARVVNAGSDACTVFLMDYGLTVEVSRWNLKYLDRFFVDLPVQAINGCLANIRPCTGENWSKDCCKRFYKLVVDKDLFAHVADTNFQRRWLSVVLSYPDTGSLISDALIRESAAADCELCEDESFSSVVYESKNPDEFIQREDGDGARRLRCDFGDSGVGSIEGKVRFPEGNKQFRKMLGLIVSDDESSSSLE